MKEGRKEETFGREKNGFFERSWVETLQELKAWAKSLGVFEGLAPREKEKKKEKRRSERKKWERFFKQKQRERERKNDLEEKKKKISLVCLGKKKKIS